MCLAFWAIFVSLTCTTETRARLLGLSLCKVKRWEALAGRKGENGMGREDNSTAMTLKARVVQALKSAEEDTTDTLRLTTLRLIAAAVRDRDVCARGRGAGEGCPDEDVRRVLETMVAQREASARQHDSVGLIEDAIREREEMAVIQQFLPSPLEGEALEAAVEQVVADLGASKLTDMGRCMSTLKARYPGLIQTCAASKAMRKALS